MFVALNAYREGDYLRVRYACEVADGQLKVTATSEHDGFVPWWKDVEVIVHKPDGTLARHPREGGGPEGDGERWSVTVSK